MTSTNNHYFIITKKPEYPGHVKAGQICYIPKHKNKTHLRPSRTSSKVSVFMVSAYSHLDYEMEERCLEELSVKEAQLLQALSEDAERLDLWRERDALQVALGLKEGTAVTVDKDGEELRGVLRYIGKLKDPPFMYPLSETFFGIELQGPDRGKGENNGTFDYRALFSCSKNCGIFAPFSRVRPVVPSTLTPSVQQSFQLGDTEELNPGDRVTYFINDRCRHGMVVNVQDKDGEVIVRISTDEDVNGKRGGEIEVPLTTVAKGEVPAEPERMEFDPPVYTDLGVNSLVELTGGTGSIYGIIRWVGMLPDRKEIMAGLELEDDRGVSDGTFKSQRFFSCPPKKALFVKLASCRPDSRFQSPSADHVEEISVLDDTDLEVECGTGRRETVPPIATEQVKQILTGRMKGIQGHCNSCYMDAALFSLFSCSSVLDSMLFKSTDPQDAPIQNTLLHDIVNPLRSKGFVEGRHIMKLRQQLRKHGYSHSFTTDEKDPEEFLTVIMHHILALDPPLKLSAAGKVQESYCYQIFLDQNHSLVLPTVQQLLEHSFHSAGLKLAEVPSCLILQMPRFGKKFKMFDKIIPSLELDITDLLSEGPQQCMLCGNLAQEECTDCFTDPLFSQSGFKVFCKKCSTQVHQHPQRRSHQPAPLDIPQGCMYRGIPHVLTRDKLELFAVLCIETSHYVSFVKHGPDPQDWIFFDSMADRQGERDGFNIPEVHACPEVGRYLSMPPAELANQTPRDMEGVAKRLFCDAYMYLYQSNSMCLYR